MKQVKIFGYEYENSVEPISTKIVTTQLEGCKAIELMKRIGLRVVASVDELKTLPKGNENIRSDSSLNKDDLIFLKLLVNSEYDNYMKTKFKEKEDNLSYIEYLDSLSKKLSDFKI